MCRRTSLVGVLALAGLAVGLLALPSVVSADHRDGHDKGGGRGPAPGKQACKDRELGFSNQGQCIKAANEANRAGEPFPPDEPPPPVVRRPEVERNDACPPGEAVPITGDTFITGSIVPGTDRDCFRVIVPTQQNVRFETFAPSDLPNQQCTNPVGSVDTLLFLRDAAGEEIAFDDDSGIFLCSLIVRDMAPGTYFIEVASFASQLIPAYTLEVDFNAAPVPPRF